MNARLIIRIGSAVVAVGLLLAVVIALLPPSSKHVVLYFSTTTGLYPGDEVRALGVVIGKIDDVAPAGTQVRVDASYDADQPIPADARAAIVAPTLVTGRYVQLAPGYNGGPTLDDNAVLGLGRTAVPVEFDEIKKELNDLAAALGPKGVNDAGALSRLVTAGSKALDGRGQTLNDTTANLAKAVTTLSDNREDVAGTVENLQTFVSALAANDQSVNEFGQRATAVAGFLAQNRVQLGEALNGLDGAVRDLQGFVRDNRGLLVGDVDRLTQVSQNLVEQQASIAGVLHSVPTTLSNFYNIYNPDTNTADGEPVLNYLQNPGNFVCGLLAGSAGQNDTAVQQTCTSALGPLLQLGQLNYPPVGTNPLTQGGAVNESGQGTGSSHAPAALPELLLPSGGGR
jgi:phospholipid/cholesterol/gamma-HCH transport system substrate-binding protein